MDLLRLREAAEAMGVSYPTVKQWIYKGEIRSVRTPGGHHRIPRGEVERLTRGARARTSLAKRTGAAAKAGSPAAVSGRNQLLGTVTAVRCSGLLAQVTLDVGGQTVTSIITRAACRELGLRPGIAAYALIKATEVMILRGALE